MRSSSRRRGRRRPAPKGAKRRVRRGWRRWHLILPRFHNPDTADQRVPVDPTLINLVYEELNGMFGGYSEQSIVGQWMGEPREHNIGLFVDVQDTPDARKFFYVYRALLEIRFRQTEIYVTSERVERVRPFPKVGGGGARA